MEDAARPSPWIVAMAPGTLGVPRLYIHLTGERNLPGSELLPFLSWHAFRLGPRTYGLRCSPAQNAGVMSPIRHPPTQMAAGATGEEPHPWVAESDKEATLW